MAGSLRKTVKTDGASKWSSTVLVAKGLLMSLLWMVPGRNCTLAIADSPKYRAGLWFAPIKWSLSVQSQHKVSGSCLTSARGHGSQSLMLFEPPAKYLSSAFSFSGFSSRLVEFNKESLVLYLFFLLTCSMHFSIFFCLDCPLPSLWRVYCKDSVMQTWSSC